MSACPVRVSGAYQNVVFPEQVQQLFKREKMSRLLMCGQPLIEFQNRFYSSQRQDMPALGNIRFHAREYPQSVFQQKGISFPFALMQKIAVQLIELQRIEVLGQAQGIQPSRLCFAEQPVGILGGKRKPFGQFPVSMKIQFQVTASFLK